MTPINTKRLQKNVYELVGTIGFLKGFFVMLISIISTFITWIKKW